MAYTRQKTLDLSSTGDYIDVAIDKTDKNINQIIEDLNEFHLTTQGDVLYKSATQSTRLAAGNLGQILKTSGAGSNPAWSVPTAKTYQRSTFSYNDNYTIKCEPATYWSNDIYLYWTSQLTTSSLSGLSPSANTWYYLYFDPQVVTGSMEISGSNLIWTASEPAWDDDYKGWYHDSSLCIFGVYTDASGYIREFFHQGDTVWYADYIAPASTVNPTTGFGNANRINQLPVFSQVAIVTITWTYDDAPSILFWRTDGQSGSTGHVVASAAAENRAPFNTLEVYTDAEHDIELKESAATSNDADIYVDGWKFPEGM